MKRFSMLFFAVCISFAAYSYQFVGCKSKAFCYSGRVDSSDVSSVSFGYSGVRIVTAFTGTSVALKIASPEKINYVLCIIDSNMYVKKMVAVGDTSVSVSHGLADKLHSLEIIKVTESSQGMCVFSGLFIDDGASCVALNPFPSRKIHFVGNSITCGYGIEVLDKTLPFSPGSENFYDTYASITARALDADWNIVARSGIGMYRNYDGPVAGNEDCMPAIYNRVFHDKPEPVWNHIHYRPDVVCVNLGTNDFSLNKGDSILFRINYQKLLDTLRGNFPATKIVLLMGPMMNTPVLSTILKRIISSRVSKGDSLLWFFEMSSQTGALGYGADWHPSRDQARKNARELTLFLSSITGWDVHPTLLSSTMQKDGMSVSLAFTDTLEKSPDLSNVSISINGVKRTIVKYSLGNDKKSLTLSLPTRVLQTDTVVVKYHGTGLKSSKGASVLPFLYVPITNVVKETKANTALLLDTANVIKLTFNKAIFLRNPSSISLLDSSGKNIYAYSYMKQAFNTSLFVVPARNIQPGEKLLLSLYDSTVVGADSVYNCLMPTPLDVQTNSTLASSSSPAITSSSMIVPNPLLGEVFELSSFFDGMIIEYCTIFSIDGRELKRINGEFAKKIDVSGLMLSRGVSFYVSVKTSQGVFTSLVVR